MKMLRQIGFSALISLGLVAGGDVARAEQDTPVVVELFTSQGCSSCPPADAFLSVLAPRDDVIALGLHVDYWDYIGWRDVFGSPVFSARQKSYARAANRRSVYTPQMIVQGEAEVVGNHPMDVADLIADFRAQPRDIALTLEREDDGMLRIEATALRDIGAPLVVQLVSDAASWIPPALGGAISGVTTDVSVTTAVAALILYAVVPAAAGLVVVQRRDVV